MRFEIYQNGAAKMHTEHENCIPSTDQLARMKKAGCTFKLDGKRYNPAQKNENEKRGGAAK